MSVPEQTEDGQILHASAVAIAGRALLITGPSGQGKSTLALDLMSRGATLVADDRVCLRRVGDVVQASPPEAIAGLIEARGIGLLQADWVSDIPIVACVDLGSDEQSRLPKPMSIDLLGQSVPLLFRVEGPHFAPALVQFLKVGRRLDP